MMKSSINDCGSVIEWGRPEFKQDLKTFRLTGVFGMSAITSVVAEKYSSRY